MAQRIPVTTGYKPNRHHWIIQQAKKQGVAFGTVINNLVDDAMRKENNA